MYRSMRMGPQFLSLSSERVVDFSCLASGCEDDDDDGNHGAIASQQRGSIERAGLIVRNLGHRDTIPSRPWSMTGDELCLGVGRGRSSTAAHQQRAPEPPYKACPYKGASHVTRDTRGGFARTKSPGKCSGMAMSSRILRPDHPPTIRPATNTKKGELC